MVRAGSKDVEFVATSISECVTLMRVDRTLQVKVAVNRPAADKRRAIVSIQLNTVTRLPEKFTQDNVVIVAFYYFPSSLLLCRLAAV